MRRAGAARFVKRPGRVRRVASQMWHEFLIALCLMLVIEGVVPFLSPGGWRNMVSTAARMDDRSLRIMGLASMLTGTALLYLVN
jgi:uncharacterized protein YjeT (DUF2065 family)